MRSEAKRKKGRERVTGKSGGGRVRLYTWRRAGLADEVGCDAMPDAAGGEGGHGAAKPDGEFTGTFLTACIYVVEERRLNSASITISILKFRFEGLAQKNDLQRKGDVELCLSKCHC